MATFDENGNYIKTDWKAGDKITAAKLNKIEESIEAVNNNDISRHVGADARLDKLESGTASDKQAINAKVDALEDVVEANKDATDLEIYSINQHMTLLDKKIDDGVAEVEAIAETVDGKIADAEVNMTAQVNQGKADMEAMVAEVEADLEGLHAKDEELSGQLADHTSRIEGFVNVVEFGISEENEDNTEIFQNILNLHSTIIIPKGTYRFKGNIVINNPVHIEGNNCTFIFEGVGSFIAINTTNCLFNRINIESSEGQNAETAQICFDMGNKEKTTRQVRFNFVNVRSFSDSAFVLNVEWHVTWKHCTIQDCGTFNDDNKTGGIVFKGEYALSSWYGSGNIIEDTYISGCNYGVWDNGAWNLQLNNVIFEYNNYPIYKGGGGRYISTNRCWFENNHHPCRGGGFVSVGDRAFEVTETNDYYSVSVRPHDKVINNKSGNSVFAMNNGAITKFTLDKASGIQTITNPDNILHLNLHNAVISGYKGGSSNSDKPSYENELVSLNGYGSYWSPNIAAGELPTSKLSLTYDSTSGGAGKAYGSFDFKASALNGNGVERELLSVFSVNYRGTISPSQLDGVSDIGRTTARYNNVYCNAIVLCSPNGSFYKVTVDDNGTLQTTKINE